MRYSQFRERGLMIGTGVFPAHTATFEALADDDFVYLPNHLLPGHLGA